MTADTLIRRKVRLTQRLVRSDHRRYDRGKPVRAKTLLRTRLHRIDVLLEKAGEFPGHTWYPGAVQEPGLNANYRRGRSLMRMMRVHFTVGTSSGGMIRNKGLAQYLIDRDGTVHAYSPADSVCADACEWNPLGFGVEVEALAAGQFTPQQIASLAQLWVWHRDTYGIPDEWHLGPDYGEGPRVPVGTDARGVYNHDALDERRCDRHFDGATAGERDAIRALAGGAPMTMEDSMKGQFIRKKGGTEVWLAVGGTRTYVTPALYSFLTAEYPAGNVIGKALGMVDTAVHDIDPALFDSYVPVTAQGGAAVDIDALAAKVAAKITVPPAPPVDYAKLAKAVNDDAAERMKS